MCNLVERLSEIPTATIANALDDVGKYLNSPISIRPVIPRMKMSGRAVTVDVDVGDGGSFSSDQFRVGSIIDAANQGDVIVVAAKGAKASIWGGMASLAASLKGISGLVVDGSVRDVDEIEECGFNVFSRYIVPTTGRSRLNVRSIGEPILIEDVSVDPGDIIIGDSTGLVIIPKAEVSNVLDRSIEYQRQDEMAAKEIKAGVTFSNVMKRFKRI